MGKKNKDKARWDGLWKCCQDVIGDARCFNTQILTYSSPGGYLSDIFWHILGIITKQKKYFAKAV